MLRKLLIELDFLNKHRIKSVMISTTAKEPTDFLVLPRRVYRDIGIASFMINDIQKVKEVLSYFDGKINHFYIDIELKQKINLYEIAQKYVKKTEIISVKPNDTTIESLDILIREKYNDNLIGKNILIIGTGNLASKAMIRLSERQAQLYVLGRKEDKVNKIISGINLFLPRNTNKIQSFNDISDINFDIVISALSNEFKEEITIEEKIYNKTLFIDVGINNFRSDFINFLLNNGNKVLRLDTRVALTYQLIRESKYTKEFFNCIIGSMNIKGVTIVAGGLVGKEGDIIVDQISNPTQIIGIADGSGGVKKIVSRQEKRNIETIKQYISSLY